METAIAVQLRFELDEKKPDKSLIKVKTIRVASEDTVYAFPPDIQSLEHHTELSNLPIVKNATKNLVKYRNLKLTLPVSIAPLYFDFEGNCVFKGRYLNEKEELPHLDTSVPESVSSSAELHSILEKLTRQLQVKEQAKEVNLSTIQKLFVLEKFDGKGNANEWITMFENECIRHRVTEEAKKIQILRLFLIENATEWYSSAIYKITIRGEWDLWRKSFLETYGDKSWRSVHHAYTYRFICGSYLDYALKKERLLLEMEPQMTIRSRINHIVVGLPIVIQDKLDKEEIISTEQLMNQLRRYTQGYSKKVDDEKNNQNETPAKLDTTGRVDFRSFDKNQRTERKPCTYCASVGFNNRFHPLELCRIRKNAEKSVNLTETTVQEIPKNE